MPYVGRKPAVLLPLVCVLMAGLVTTHQSIAQAGPSRVEQTQLPLVLFVHGRGQKDRADQEIRVEWLSGFRAGQRDIGALDLIPTSAIAFTFYQHAFEQPPDPAVPTPSACADAVARAERSEALLIFDDDSLARSDALTFHSRSFENAAVQMARDALTIVSPDLMLRVFTALFGRDTHDWLERGIEYDATRCRIELAFAHAGKRPIIVVAHSQGTLAVYDYLVNGHRGDAIPDIARFITLGSQLGNPAMIARLDTSRRQVPYHYPKQVKSWVNLHDYEDFITFPITWEGKPMFEAGKSDSTPPIELGINDPSSYHHQIGAYLAHPFTARAIAAAWCDAARTSGTYAATSCATYNPRDVLLERDQEWHQSVPKKAEHVTKFAFLAGTGAFIGFQAADHNNWPRATMAWVGAFVGASYAWLRDSGVTR